MRAYKVYLLIYTYIDGIVRRNNIVKKKKRNVSIGQKKRFDSRTFLFSQTFSYLHPHRIITTLPRPTFILLYTRLGLEFPHPFWNRRHFDGSGNIGVNRVRIKNKTTFWFQRHAWHNTRQSSFPPPQRAQ